MADRQRLVDRGLALLRSGELSPDARDTLMGAFSAQGMGVDARRALAEGRIERSEPSLIPPGVPGAGTERAAPPIVEPTASRQPGGAMRGMVGMGDVTEAVPTTDMGERSLAFERFIRNPAVLAGGLAGAEKGLAAGAPFGPLGAAAGGLAGGALGAAAGSLAGDIGRTATNIVAPGQFTPVEPGEALRRAGTEAAMDVLGAGAGAVAGEFVPRTLFLSTRVGQRLFGRVTGMTTEAAQSLAQKAQRLGIPLGVTNITESAFPRAAADVVGVFPIINMPFKAARQAQDVALHKKLSEATETLGPGDLLAEDMGFDLAEAVKGLSDEFRRVEGVLWDSFRHAARSLEDPNIVPTDETRRLAAEMALDIERQKVPLVGGGVIEPPDALRDFVGTLNKLQKRMTPDQARGLQLELKRVMDQAQKEGWSLERGRDLKRAIKTDLANLVLEGSPEAERVAQLFSAANEFTARGLIDSVGRQVAGAIDPALAKRMEGGKDIFRGPVSAQIRDMVPEVYQAGLRRMSPRTQEEVFNVAMNMKSPTMVDDLANLVGDDMLQQVARRSYDEALTAATKDVRRGTDVVQEFSPTEFRRNLGFERRGLKDEARLRLLERSGVDTAALDDLLQVASRMRAVPSPRQLIMRRAALGGARSAAKAVLPVTAAAGGGATLAGGLGAGGGALIALSFQRLARNLASPQAIKELQAAFNQNLSDQVRRGHIVRFLRLTAPADEEQQLLKSEEQQLLDSGMSQAMAMS